MNMSDTPLLKVKDLSKFYGSRIGCQNVSLAVAGRSAGDCR